MRMKNIILSLMLMMCAGSAYLAVAASQVVPLGQVVTTPVAIPSGQPTGGPVMTNGMSPVGILLPAAFTSTTLTFAVSPTLTGTYVPLFNSSGSLSYTVAQGHYVSINPVDFYGVQFFKIIFGSNEAAARTVTISMKGI